MSLARALADRPKWWPRSDRLHRWLVIRSGNVSSTPYSPYSPRDAEMLAFALAGEVGEVVQLFYKRIRDAKDNDEFRAALRKELADARIYLELLVEAVDGDTDADVAAKLDEVEARWMPKGYVP